MTSTASVGHATPAPAGPRPDAARPENASDWWRQAVVYQIYPRSFVDLNGDGIGDLPGISSRADYLSSLGIDAVWLTPFYPSALVDGGYDVADYRNIDPHVGTLRQFDSMLEILHRRGLRVFIDLVPNHSSNLHPWFQEALAAGPGSAARDRYIFRDGKGEQGELPPNDWPSHWADSCWTRVPDGQWYLHLFAPEQPDLNWEHEEVRADFLKTIRFWADRGVDGFRVDVAHGLVKQVSEPYVHLESLAPRYLPTDGSHPLLDRDGLQDVYRQWRQVFDAYQPPIIAVGEVGAALSRRHRYTASDALHQAFNFELLEEPFKAERFRAVIDASLENAADTNASSTWVLSNHDVVRHVSRYGLPDGVDLNAWLLTGGTRPRADLTLGTERARAAVALLLALPGSLYVYQGEELGLPEVASIPIRQLQDPIWERSGNASKGRDGCRVPLPWTRDGEAHGFSPNRAHLPQPAWFGDLSVEAQDGVAGSMLEFYRHALRLRRDLQTGEMLQWLEAPSPDVLYFQRPNGWRCLTNFGSRPVSLPTGELLLASAEPVGRMLPANATAWLRQL